MLAGTSPGEQHKQALSSVRHYNSSVRNYNNYNSSDYDGWGSYGGDYGGYDDGYYGGYDGYDNYYGGYNGYDDGYGSYGGYGDYGHGHSGYGPGGCSTHRGGLVRCCEGPSPACNQPYPTTTPCPDLLTKLLCTNTASKV